MIAALFPGQGSQHIGMGEFLYKEFPLVKRLFEEASDELSINFKKLLFEGSEKDLALTENTQPAILLVSVASYRLLSSLANVSPTIAAGHSIGEYSALVAAGVLPFNSAIKLVRSRGQYMQEAVAEGIGGMAAAMGLTEEQVDATCKWAEEKSQLGVIEPANYNCPGQIVISGHKKAIDWLSSHFSDQALMSLSEEQRSYRRVKFIPLKVSAPFHCSLMKPAEDKMHPLITETVFKESEFDVVQNYKAEVSESTEQCQEQLIRQISSPVRWVECVKKFTDHSPQVAIEFGAGKVLNGLVKKINPALKVLNLNSIDDLKLIETTLTKGAS